MSLPTSSSLNLTTHLEFSPITPLEQRSLPGPTDTTHVIAERVLGNSTLFSLIRPANERNFSLSSSSQNPKQRNGIASRRALFTAKTLISTTTSSQPQERPVLPGIRITPPGSPVQQQKKLRCPPGPHPVLKVTDPFSVNALRIINTMQINKDTYLAPIVNMRGEHSQIYTIESDQNLIPGVANEDIYIKIFLEEVLEKKGDTVGRSYVTNMLSQHAQLKEAGFRIVNIFNLETALTDGYLAVEKLSKFQISWNASTAVEDMSQKDKDHLEYLLSLFEFGLKNPSRLSLDIHRGNFGLDKNGNLVLLDLMEEDEDEPYAFFLYARIHALSLSNENMEIYELFKNIVQKIACEGNSDRARALHEHMCG